MFLFVAAALSWTRHIKMTDQAGLDFMRINGLRRGVVTLDSGLQYLELEKGSSTFSPKDDNKCSYEYKGWYPKVRAL